MTQRSQLVSVIIPVYAAEDYLERCVRSVTGQSHRDLEILLVNDGSPDRCPEMCDSFAREDSRVIVIHQENAGQGAARNAALDICTGDYIMFVDADDVIEPDMVASLVGAAVEQDCDIALCGWQTVSLLRKVENRFYEAPVLMDGESLLREYLLSNSIIGAPWSKLFKRHLFDSIRFPLIRAKEDTYVMHELLGGANRAVFVPEPHYVYAVRPGSTEMSGVTPAFLAAADVGDRIVEYIAARAPSLMMYAQFHRALQMSLLMQRIRSSFSYRANRSLYLNLRTAVRSELDHLDPDELGPSLDFVVRSARDGIAFRTECLVRGAYYMALRILDRTPAGRLRGVGADWNEKRDSQACGHSGGS